MRARDVMSQPVITVRPTTPIKEAAALLAEHRISGAPVVDESGELVGIVSEADLIALETTPDPRSQARPLPPRERPLPRTVAEVMTREVIVAEEDTDVAVVAQRMLQGGVKRLPVLRGRRLVGIVSRHDLLELLTRDDRDIEAGVRAALDEEGRSFARIRVRVDNGVVELSGESDIVRLRIAEVRARAVPGVLDVRIHPPTGPDHPETPA